MDSTILRALATLSLLQELPEVHIVQEVTPVLLAKQLLALLANIVKTLNWQRQADLVVKGTSVLWDLFLLRHLLLVKEEDALNLNFALKEVQLELNAQQDFTQTVLDFLIL